MKQFLLEKQIILGGFSIVVILIIGLVSFLTKPIIDVGNLTSTQNPSSTPLPSLTPTQSPTPSPTPSPTLAAISDNPDDSFRKILFDAIAQIKKQEQVDKELSSELHTGNYTFESPLIVIDPYDFSPLCALLLFTTTEPTKISIIVNGEDPFSNISFTFPSYQNEHFIPIYGLYADKKNGVTLISESVNGEIKENNLEIKTEPLTDLLANNIILTDSPIRDRYQPGLNFTYAYAKSAFDINGKYRWFLNNNYLQPSGFLYNNFIFAQGATLSGNVIFSEINPLGRIYRLLYSPYGVHHDIANYQNNLLITGSDGETVEDFIYELDTQTGKINHTLDLKNIFQRSRLGIEDPDWFHNNAISWDPRDYSIIISSYVQSSVAKISWPEGKLKWVLAPNYGWLPMFEKYLLRPVGQNFEYSYRQHAPEILPDQDNNPNTIDILLFDNGNDRYLNDAELQRKVRANEIVPPELYSRMVQYRIDEAKKTIVQIWQYGKEYGKLIYSSFCGSANLLENGNRLGFF